AKPKAIIAVAVVIAILPICWLLVHIFPHKNAPDPDKMTDEQAVKYVISKDFTKLPETEKIKYMDKMRAKRGDEKGPPPQIANLTQAERQTMMKNMRPFMEKKMKEDMKKFFAMSQSEQEAEMDRRIEEMEARRKNDNVGGPPPGGPGRDPRGMFEGSDSTTRAQMSKMMKMMRARMQAKGISGPGGPPP
ncbi:MAG: hypothetical protein NT118_14430, partial [Lentisphaerae bacterium]|nr:hypothetical protein [Lentisphaerota bacterium]